MRTFLSCIAFLLITAAAKAQSLTPQQIICRNIDSTGGRELLLSIRTMYTDYSTDMEGHAVHWIIKEMLPNKGSFEIMYNGRTMYKNWYTGSKGFEIVNGEIRRQMRQNLKTSPTRKIFLTNLIILIQRFIRLRLWARKQ